MSETKSESIAAGMREPVRSRAAGAIGFTLARPGCPGCRVLCAILLMVATIAGCLEQGAPEPSAASHTSAGEVRIAALSPAIAVMLRDLGHADRIVARHAWDMVLDADQVPAAGDQSGLDYEVLLRVQPTHILLEWGARPLPARLVELASRQHWQVENFALLTLDDIQHAARQLHERFGSGEPWEETAVSRRWNETLDKREGAERAGRILLLYSARPPGALGPGSAHHQVLEAIGGTPALTSGSPYISLDTEDVLRLAPDGIILIVPRSARAGSNRDGSPPAHMVPRMSVDAESLGRIGTLEIPAVRNGRIALIDHPLGQLPSTSLMEIADQMAEILRIWAQEPGAS